MKRFLVFLSIVGVAYIVLGLWCAALPESTARAVGFELLHAGGRSEFFTVYGGMELGFGLVFLLPLLDRSTLKTVLLVCMLVHGGLVCFRGISLLLDSAVPTLTWMLAVTEWLIFLSIIFLFRQWRTMDKLRTTARH